MGVMRELCLVFSKSVKLNCVIFTYCFHNADDLKLLEIVTVINAWKKTDLLFDNVFSLLCLICLCFFLHIASMIYAISCNNLDINKVVAEIDTVGGIKP